MDSLRKMVRWVAAHRWLTAISLLVLLLALAWGSRYRRKTEGELTPAISRGVLIESVYGIGTVTAERTYDLKPGTISSISEEYVHEGDHVAKGQPLVRFDQRLVRAPFSGTVTYFPYKTDELVFVQSLVLRLVDLESRYVLVSLEQQGMLRVRPGQTVQLSFDTLRERDFSGRVDAVYSNDGRFYGRIRVPRLPPEILPGMTADVAIEVGRREQALIVPAAALERGRVWVKRGRGLVHETPVEIGVVDTEKAEILSGDLREGDRLVIRKRAEH